MPSNMTWYRSVLPRVVASRTVRVSSPRARGDQGIEPTPNIWEMTQCEMQSCRERTRGADLERRKHLALLFAVEQTVVVLHGDEGCEVVRDGVVCQFARSVKIETMRLYTTYSAWRGLRD